MPATSLETTRTRFMPSTRSTTWVKVVPVMVTGESCTVMYAPASEVPSRDTVARRVRVPSLGETSSRAGGRESIMTSTDIEASLPARSNAVTSMAPGPSSRPLRRTWKAPPERVAATPLTITWSVGNPSSTRPATRTDVTLRSAPSAGAVRVITGGAVSRSTERVYRAVLPARSVAVMTTSFRPSDTMASSWNEVPTTGTMVRPTVMLETSSETQPAIVISEVLTNRG